MHTGLTSPSRGHQPAKTSGAGWGGGISYRNTARGLLPSHRSPQQEGTPLFGKREAPFPRELLPPSSPESAFQQLHLPSRYRKILLLPAKHIAKARPHPPELESKQRLFQAPSLLPSACCTIWSDGVPLWGDRKEDKPTLPKGCNFLQP